MPVRRGGGPREYARFLGATGAAEDDVALSIIEQLMIRGIQASPHHARATSALCRPRRLAAGPDPATEAKEGGSSSGDVAVFTREAEEPAALDSRDPPGWAPCRRPSGERNANMPPPPGRDDGLRRRPPTRPGPFIMAKSMDLLAARPDGVVTLPRHRLHPRLRPVHGQRHGRSDTKLFARSCRTGDHPHSRGDRISAEGEPMKPREVGGDLMGWAPHARRGGRG